VDFPHGTEPGAGQRCYAAAHTGGCGGKGGKGVGGGGGIPFAEKGVGAHTARLVFGVVMVSTQLPTCPFSFASLHAFVSTGAKVRLTHQVQQMTCIEASEVSALEPNGRSALVRAHA
jgi:hypothetical protein